MDEAAPAAAIGSADAVGGQMGQGPALLKRRHFGAAGVRAGQVCAAARAQLLPWNSSRPISMRRISLVPAPIS